VSPTATASAAVVPSGPDDYQFQVVAKAQPDEWFTGIGELYTPITDPQPAGALAKVNQAYVWSLTEAGDNLWFGTGANVASMGHTSAGGAAAQNAISVTEGSQSRYPISPEYMRQYIGDWRPPEVWRYNTLTGQAENLTPNDSRINQTFGLRSAGSTDEVVLLAGPATTFTGINVFAFDAQTSEYLGSQQYLQYGDIRSWVRYEDQLYTGVLRTFSQTGEGAVLRWQGNRSNPFRFQEVGALDNEAANLAIHDGRLFVSTWTMWSASLMGIQGYRSTADAGLWMSPELGSDGLAAADTNAWQKVWDMSEYDPDPVIRRSLGGGAMYSFDGYLYWGTMQVNGVGMTALQEAYPNDVLPSQAFYSSFRASAFFRGRDFDVDGARQVELLYGDLNLWTYTPAGADPTTEPGTFTLKPNRMNTAGTFGSAGFGTGTNYYTWSATVHDNMLYVGTIDYSPSRYVDQYIAANGDVASLVPTLHATLGADLVVFPASNGTPFKASEFGAGNPLNYGIRTMVSTSQGLFLGSASASNLLTDPTSPLHAGGWELIKVSTVPGPQLALDHDQVAENSSAGTVVGRFSVSPSGTYAFRLLDDAGGRFTLVGDELQVAAPNLLDFEAAQQYAVNVQATGDSVFEQVFTILLTNVNEAPVAIALDNAAVPAGIMSGAMVGYLEAIDPDAGEKPTFTLVDNAGGRFQITDRALCVADGALLAAGTTAQVVLRATDSGGLTHDTAFTINATDLAAASHVGLCDPNTFTFYLRNSPSTGAADYTFGYGDPTGGWQQLVGDWDGNGTQTIGFFDPVHSVFYLRNENTAGYADYTFGYGDPTQPWSPLVGDWDGDGIDTIGFFDRTSFVFYLRNENTAGFADHTFGYGDPAQPWKPLIGDWDGNGTDTIGFFDPAASVFYLRNSLDAGFADRTFGYGGPDSAWTPLVGDWDGNGADSVGFYDPQSSVFHLRNDNTTGYAHYTFGFGVPGAQWVPLSGRWNAPAPSVPPPATLDPNTVDQLLTASDDVVTELAAIRFTA
jgi:hypothetical protein